MLAIPLPYRPIAFDGPYVVEPVAPLACKGSTWEDAVVSLVEGTLEPRGLVVEVLSRVPYLAGADVRAGVIVHDDAVLICRRSPSCPIGHSTSVAKTP